jgi:uncharacterized radical SAM superfamily protein
MQEGRVEETKESVIAVSAGAYAQFGCPHCGAKAGEFLRSGDTGSAWKCADIGRCGKTFAILAPGVTEAGFTIDGVAPVLMVHPLRPLKK